jgi:hypothetical protein
MDDERKETVDFRDLFALLDFRPRRHPIAPDRRDPNMAAHLRDDPPYAEELEGLRPCDD